MIKYMVSNAGRFPAMPLPFVIQIHPLLTLLELEQKLDPEPCIGLHLPVTQAGSLTGL